MNALDAILTNELKNLEKDTISLKDKIPELNQLSDLMAAASWASFSAIESEAFYGSGFLPATWLTINDENISKFRETMLIDDDPAFKVKQELISSRKTTTSNVKRRTNV